MRWPILFSNHDDNGRQFNRVSGKLVNAEKFAQDFYKRFQEKQLKENKRNNPDIGFVINDI
jgi:hypothetical protein